MSNQQQQEQLENVRANFSGKWELDSSLTEGDVDKCMKLLGRTNFEIGLLKRASESQLVHQYVVDGTHAIHKNVNYCVLHVKDFRYETCLRLDNERQYHKEDHKKFGDCSTKSKWKSPTTYCVMWCMKVKGMDTEMKITRTLVDKNLTSVTMSIKQKSPNNGKHEAESVKYYHREHRTDNEKRLMSEMCSGKEHALYKTK